MWSSWVWEAWKQGTEASTTIAEGATCPWCSEGVIGGQGIVQNCKGGCCAHAGCFFPGLLAADGPPVCPQCNDDINSPTVLEIKRRRSTGRASRKRTRTSNSSSQLPRSPSPPPEPHERTLKWKPRVGYQFLVNGRCIPPAGGRANDWTEAELHAAGAFLGDNFVRPAADTVGAWRLDAHTVHEYDNVMVRHPLLLHPFSCRCPHTSSIQRFRHRFSAVHAQLTICTSGPPIPHNPAQHGIPCSLWQSLITPGTAAFNTCLKCLPSTQDQQCAHTARFPLRNPVPVPCCQAGGHPSSHVTHTPPDRHPEY